MLQKITVLYVEDDNDTQEITASIMERAGYRVLRAEDGTRALKLYENSCVDIVLTDIQMPRQNGLELVAKLRRINPDQPIIFLTAYNNFEYLIKALDMHAQGYLLKPVGSRQLLRKLDEVSQNLLYKKHYQNHQALLETIFAKQRSLTFTTDFQKVTFASRSFMEFFQIETLEQFHRQYEYPLQAFVCQEGFVCGKSAEEFLQTYEEKPEQDRYVSIISPMFEPKAFQIDITPFKERECGLYIITLTDISTLKTKNTLTRLELEKRVRQLEEQGKILTQQSKMAAMGEMLDAVAHQWKQPLGVIKMHTQMMEYDNENGDLDPQEISQTAAVIEKQIDHLVDTLEDFRNFFRPVEKWENTAVGEVIDQTLRLLKDTLMKNSIQVFSKGVLGARVDLLSNEFKHVLINIINNATDTFNDRGIDTMQRCLNFLVKETDKEVVLTIRDNAGGIEEGVIDTLFNANVTTKAEGKGTGIGLYMSKQIIQKMEGRISVHNSSEGACFVITLPKSRLH